MVCGGLDVGKQRERGWGNSHRVPSLGGSGGVDGVGVGRSGEGVEGTDAGFVDALAEACGDGGLSGGLGRCRRVMDQTRGGCDRGDFRADRLIVSFLPSFLPSFRFRGFRCVDRARFLSR